jgi:GT2 family glycosyltransferase
MTPRALDIIVPVYKNAALTEQCVRSILTHLGEIEDRTPRLLLINDSPDDEEVARILSDFAANDLRRCLILTNEENLGFVQTVNRGIEIAVSAGRDVLLVNSDTVTFEGTLREIVTVAAIDPQIGFVSPRSNNASICSLPHFHGGKQLGAEECYKKWQCLSVSMPAFHYTPTAVGFYLFVAYNVLRNQGALSEDFGLGYEEENDLIMRAGKVGVRAAVANHAFVYHTGSASFSLTGLDAPALRSQNLLRLTDRHPEFLPLVRRYEASPHYRAERLMSGLLPDGDGRVRLVFDLTSMGQHYNGTNEHTVAVLKQLVANWSEYFRIAGLASKEVFSFHGLDRLHGLERDRPEAPGLHAIAIRLAQPFDIHHINVLERLAPINLYAMLDTIAEDCGPLAAEHDLSRLWNHVASHANGLLFNSKCSERSFCLRHPAAAALPRMTQLLSTTTTEYQANLTMRGSNSHVLVLGNHFPHKGSEMAGRLLSQAFPTIQFVVLGGENRQESNVTMLRSGGVEAESMQKLICDATAIVLPSYVEGFGLGLMHALAARKPTVVRKIRVTEEILATFDNVEGVFLFETNADLPAALARALNAKSSACLGTRQLSWRDWGDAVVRLCTRLVAAPDTFTKLVQRVEASDALSHLALTSMPPPSLSPNEPVGPQATVRASTVPQLLCLNGRAFVEAAYRLVLRREADPSGLGFYVAEVEGGLDKREVLRALATSPEGRGKAADVPGLSEFLEESAERSYKAIFRRLVRTASRNSASNR